MVQIEPMNKCLHGLECDFLFAPGDESPICLLNRVPIFDMRRCPKELWFFDPEPFKEQSPERPQASPGDCENCPAAGTWNYGSYANQGLLCFHAAYYQGKSGKPKPCSTERENCPRLDDEIHRKELVESGQAVVGNAGTGGSLSGHGRVIFKNNPRRSINEKNR